MSELTIADLREYVSNREGEWSNDRGMTLAELDALLAAHDKEVLEKAARRVFADLPHSNHVSIEAMLKHHDNAWGCVCDGICYFTIRAVAAVRGEGA